jgi:hypothetical protein
MSHHAEDFKSWLAGLRLLDIFATAGASTVAHLLLRMPIRHTPMYGDDFLGIRVAQMPIRSGSFAENLWLVGGGKWRPVTTPLLLFLGQMWGYSYAPYQILNSVLLIILATATGIFSLRLTSKRVPSILISVAVVSSQFNWFSQISIYGIMELLALIFLIGSIAVVALQDPESTKFSSRVSWSVAFLLIASFCHERYIICSVVFAAYLFILQRKTGAQFGAWKHLLVPATHVLLKAFVVNVDPLTGGGESNFRDAAGPWIAAHFLDTLKMLIGWFSGAGHFYNGDRLGESAKAQSFGLTGASIAMFALLVTAIHIIHCLRAGQSGRRVGHDLERTFLLTGIAISCLIPAATVVQRIEARWIFASQILLLVASVAGVSATVKTRASLTASLLPAAFTLLAVAYLPGSSAYTALRDQPTAVLETLHERAPRAGPWSVVITQSDSEISAAWQFGYGDALSQLPNPPYFTNISSDVDAVCIQQWRKMPCMRVILEGFRIVGVMYEQRVIPFSSPR